MLRLLIDTCVWLDMAKDYRHKSTLSALENMIEAGEVSLVLPKQAINEFARNKDRIIRDSGKSSQQHVQASEGSCKAIRSRRL